MLFKVAQGNFLAIDEDITELAPLRLCHFLALLILSHIEHFISQVHDQVYHPGRYLDVDLPLSELSVAMDLGVLDLLSLNLDFAVSFACHGLPLALHLHLFVLDIHLCLDIEGLGSSLVSEHSLALA